MEKYRFMYSWISCVLLLEIIFVESSTYQTILCDILFKFNWQGNFVNLLMIGEPTNLYNKGISLQYSMQSDEDNFDP